MSSYVEGFNMPLPNELIDVFRLDEGTRPGIYFENLSKRELVYIYKHLKESSQELSSKYTVWSRKLQQDIPINSYDNPAEQLIAGEIEQFCHPIIEYCSRDIHVDCLSIFMFPDSIEFFYDVRDIGAEHEIESVLALVKNVNAMCVKCQPFFGEECGKPRELRYQEALITYLNG